MHVYVLVRGIHVVVRILSSFLNVSIFSCNQKQGSLADSEDWEDLLGFEVRGKMRNSYLGQREADGFYCTITLAVFSRN